MEVGSWRLADRPSALPLGPRALYNQSFACPAMNVPAASGRTIAKVHAVLRNSFALRPDLPRAAPGDPAAARQGRRHCLGVRRQQQPDGVWCAGGCDAADAGHHRLRGAVHGGRAGARDYRAEGSGLRVAGAQAPVAPATKPAATTAPAGKPAAPAATTPAPTSTPAPTPAPPSAPTTKP